MLFAVLDEPDLTIRAADAALHPGLVLQAQQRGVGIGQGGFRELPDRADTVSSELLALRRAHPRHEQQIVGGHDLLLAVVAAATGGDSGRTPVHWAGLRQMRGSQRKETVPPLAEDRQDLRKFVVAPDVIEAAARERNRGAQDQRHGRIRCNPRLEQLVAVGAKLEQGSHLGVAGQFGVEHRVAAVGLADQEIGAAMELAVEEGGLEHHVGAGTQGVDGFPVLGQQRGPVHGLCRDDVVHAASGGRIPVAELRDETVEDFVLVEVPQCGGMLEHLVVFEGGFRGAAQLLVELPEQLVLTAGGRDEVARGEDQVRCGTRHFRFKEKHCAPDADAPP